MFIQAVLSLGLITLGVQQRREAHHEFNSNLQFIQSSAKSQGVEIDVTSLRYVQLAMSFVLLTSGAVALFRRSCLLKSLTAVAILFLFAQTFAQLFRNAADAGVAIAHNNSAVISSISKLCTEKCAVALVYLASQL